MLGYSFQLRENGLGDILLTACCRELASPGCSGFLEVLTLDCRDCIEDSHAKAQGRKPKDALGSQAQNWCHQVPESAWEGQRCLSSQFFWRVESPLCSPCPAPGCSTWSFCFNVSSLRDYLITAPSAPPFPVAAFLCNSASRPSEESHTEQSERFMPVQ